MNLSNHIAQMQHNATTIAALVANLDNQQARWKPSAEAWSILETINHLYDEERRDFRLKLDYMWHRPGEKAPSIDPDGWVRDEKYNERDLAESLANFQTERANSIAWLESLAATPWDTMYPMPWGEISAGDMFAAWVAHDLLHMRQLVEILYAMHTANVAPNTPRYAGEW